MKVVETEWPKLPDEEFLLNVLLLSGKSLSYTFEHLLLLESTFLGKRKFHDNFGKWLKLKATNINGIALWVIWHRRTGGTQN